MKTELSLYKLTDEIEKLEETLLLNHGEVTDEHAALEQEIYSMIQSKTDGCVEFLKKRDDLIDLAKGRINELRDFINKQERIKENFHSYIFLCMDKMKTKEIKGQMYTFKERKPSTCVVVENEELIPFDYTEIEMKKKIKLNEIKTAIKNGEDVAGARLADGKRSLTIKMG